MKYERETCNLLRRLGVNNSYVGFRYTVYGVIRAIANPELLIYISKGLYVEISAEYHTSIGCVEDVYKRQTQCSPLDTLALVAP